MSIQIMETSKNPVNKDNLHMYLVGEKNTYTCLDISIYTVYKVSVKETTTLVMFTKNISILMENVK